MLAGCASDGTSLLSTTEQTPPPPAAETAEAPPPAAAPPSARSSTPARSTTAAKPPAQAAEKKTAKTEKQQPARQPASETASTKANSPFNGSWQFSNGQKACMMTLSTANGASGSVSASGDCWNAYSKAKGWKLQGNEMVLTDSGNQPIARMQSTGATRYDGYGAEGEPVVLVR
ncbi:AprI/Inh family metalloprotease inhibitor [Blastochloris tepida]|nr:AprI/Inh family metalloprotease inhibitor [Blastochloris tepida]